MTRTTVLVVENLFSGVQFPQHTVSAEEETSGFEAFRVANGRRSALNYWKPTTANSDTWLKAACDQVRAANFFALDRGHNLAGKTVTLQVSNDDFTTSETAFSGVIPAATAPGSLDDALGVRTMEGVWLKRFDVRAGSYWRLFVPAMGAGLTPQVVGLWVGMAWELGAGLRLPVSPSGGDVVAEMVESAVGWAGRGRATQRRAGTLTYKYPDELEAELGAYHVEGHMGLYRPAWLIHDTRRSDQAVLVTRTAESLGGVYEEGWVNKQGIRLSYVEHEAQAA